MRRVYVFLDLDIAPALPAMSAYSRRTRRQKRRPHLYSLAQFGLCEGQVIDQMADYMRRFDIALEQERTRKG